MQNQPQQFQWATRESTQGLPAQAQQLPSQPLQDVSPFPQQDPRAPAAQSPQAIGGQRQPNQAQQVQQPQARQIPAGSSPQPPALQVRPQAQFPAPPQGQLPSVPSAPTVESHPAQQQIAWEASTTPQVSQSGQGQPAQPAAQSQAMPAQQSFPAETSPQQLQPIQQPELRKSIGEVGERQSAPEQAQPTTSPYVDIYDNPEDITVVADLPGCTQENVTLEGTDTSLRIMAERPASEGENEDRAVQRERIRRSERLIQLPTAVDLDSAEATCENGICTVKLPKREETRQRKIAFQ